ncbi:hypothetical protein CAPTEDRAFT_223236 [Capitella teleta]|uniref:BZIP domain-containing protein n=1 Tax=Capitella teleta TaxID=283909 RepID=R7TQ49_CAPTE|nr:hypothetical protein CAPTEDRAFT_223236 [Capitella teleta]|eukprot:ELT95774.1 hypothetical protein CAPTEDRAFT_223236 [Capitella teleta]
MASATEMALDLSAKSAPSTPVLLDPASSPVPSITSSDNDDLPDQRSPSASSLSSGPPSPSAAAATPDTRSFLPLPPLSLPVRVKEENTGAVAPISNRNAPSSMRPFKMYPFEPINSSIYSQFASQQATAAATAGLYPLGALPGSSAAPSQTSTLPMSFFDSNAVSLSSPITQYLQQRKRRHDGRASSGSTSSVDSMGSAQPQEMHPHEMQLPSSYSTSGAVPGSPAGSECKKARLHPNDVEQRRDDAYWERRRKNNEAAKRSRDARRAKEEEIALRAAFLEQENLKLRAQVAILKNETAKLHYMLYNRL